ncbi:zona occludens toxin [Methylobacter tundripaludum]|uniref:Zona occludens toxin n=1 Tax=Methylobacter tundripaludum TaxID=173365 RepID=A0A2S6GPV3_9GAMM|nr:zonular occludens toxin domain-containing protein [Methylobacter tundripaludum]PPK67254.1 zona occludens toxin [Methylobacter tundripaludum]
MITLITGGPGTGKTAWLLNQLLDLRVAEPDRLFFIHGVRNLRGIAHETIYCRSQLCDICRGQDADIEARLKTAAPPKFVEDWPKWKEPNSLIVVDEVQRIWRPTNGAQGVHESISTLETHRHYGVDFWLISQGPHLFHNFIRLLVGRHVHLVAKWSGRTEYEWPECKQDVQSRSDAVQRPYTLPKRVYDLYDSAEVHTKQDKRKPLSFYATIGALVLAVVVGGFVIYRIKNRINPVEASTAAPVPGSPSASTPPAAGVSPTDIAFPDFEPKIPGVPESAPAYAGLVKIVAAPILAGCVLNKRTDKCSCYTHQATPYPASQAYCFESVQNHRFNPYLERHTAQRQGALVSDQPANKAPEKG